MTAASSPKRRIGSASGFASMFPYYAGFEFDWAAGELDRNIGSRCGVVLDPWNGAGTTTVAAGSLGVGSVGMDMSPIASVVASARSIAASGAGVPYVARLEGRDRAVADTDPLLKWFSRQAVEGLRELTFQIGCSSYSSSLAWVALFRVVQRLTSSIEGSNPTWVRKLDPEQRVEVGRDELHLLVEHELDEIRRAHGSSAIPGFVSPLLVTADSRLLPLGDSCISTVLTSPPYLTRLDYAVAFSRELALLDDDPKSLELRRRTLMGTTASRRGLAGWGHDQAQLTDAATELSEAVRQHPSKDSSGYYYRNICQYLVDLNRSMAELNRVTVTGARIGVVVQDSYYKDVPIQLGMLVDKDAQRLGWTLKDSVSQVVPKSMTSLNSAARQYEKSQVSEHVLWFQRS